MTSQISVKERNVNELVDKIKESRTLMIVSVKGLPSKQYHEIKKSIREDADVKIAKKNIILRALKKYGKESIIPLEGFIESDFAIVFSDKDGYELAGVLAKKKTPVFAKAGQVSNKEIDVQKGPTDLVPGPAISELGALGIQIAVENGKISIKQNKIIVNEGQIITENVASLLQKLNIQPFNVELKPVAIYDTQNEKIYKNIEIDSDKIVNELISNKAKALGLAQKLLYYCKETIGYFLCKAELEGKFLSRFEGDESKKEEMQEIKSKEGENVNE